MIHHDSANSKLTYTTKLSICNQATTNDQKKSAEFELSCFAKTSNPKRYTHTQAPKYHTQP